MNEEFEDFFQDDEYTSLVNRYEEMLENNTRYFFDVVEFENIIDYYIDSDKSNNALNVIEYASQQHPYSINIQLKKAQVLINKGFASKALSIIDKIEKIESSNSDVFLLKGSAFNVMGKFLEAEKAFDVAIHYAYEDKAGIIHTIAQSFEQIGKYKVALKYLHQAFELDNKNIMLLYDIGYCYEKIGQIKNGILYYNRYLDKEPFSENAWYNLGVLYGKNQQHKKAIEAYEFALAINPDFSVLYFNLANVYLSIEDFENAIKNYKEYINFDGNSVEILTYIGDCYEGLKDYNLALEYYDKALNLDGYFSDTYFGKANVLYRLGNSAQALQFIDKAIKIDDANAEYYYLKGSIENDLNNFDKAIIAFHNAYKLQPEEIDFILSLTESYINAKKYKFAILELKEAVNNFNDELLYYRLSACYFLINKKEEALAAFEKGLKINPDNYNDILLYYPQAADIVEVNNLLDKCNVKK